MEKQVQVDKALLHILYKNYKNFNSSIVDIVDNKIKRIATISARARIVKPEDLVKEVK